MRETHFWVSLALLHKCVDCGMSATAPNWRQMQNELILVVFLNGVWTQYPNICEHTHTHTLTYTANTKSINSRARIVVPRRNCLRSKRNIGKRSNREKNKGHKYSNEIKQSTQKKFAIALRNVDVCHDLMRLKRWFSILYRSDVSESTPNPNTHKSANPNVNKNSQAAAAAAAAAAKKRRSNVYITYVNTSSFFLFSPVFLPFQF